MIKSSAIFLSIALLASSFAISGAPAAPVDYVRVCDAYGAGFFYIPGTDTCENADTGETRRETANGTVYGKTKVRERADQAVDAAALSLAMKPATVTSGHTFALSANTGAVAGSTAVGVSGAFALDDNLTFNGSVGAALNSGDMAGSAGVNYSW